MGLLRRKPKAGGSRQRRAGDCVDVGCTAAECFACNALVANVVLASVAGFPGTPRVSEGSAAARPLLRLIRSYQANVSAHRPAVCHLTPTCSHHAYDVLLRRGARGLPEVRRRLRACARAGRAARSAGSGTGPAAS